MPSHRVLALLRGRKRRLPCAWRSCCPTTARHGPTSPSGASPARAGIEQRGAPPTPGSPRRCAGPGSSSCCASLEADIEQRLREQAEAEAIRVFGRNLHDLLLAAPAGQRVTMGLDPGIRTGVKVAVVDGTGKLLDTATVYPHEPRNDWEGSLRTLGALCAKHGVQLISIGNGTASRETDKLAGDLLDAACPSAARRRSSCPKPARRSTRRRSSRRRSSRTSTCRCAARCRSRAGCRIRSPSWCASSRRRSASASTSTTSARRSWPESSTPWSRTASTRSAPMSTRRRRRCWRASPA